MCARYAPLARPLSRRPALKAATPCPWHGCCIAIDNRSQSLQMVRMIICVCRGLNTSKVNDAIAAGARSPRAVHAHHETTINCGKCCETVCGMIREHGANDGEPCEMLVAAE
jgi:bacterioferritin-associated ferredoxin